jgi:hypothetical protein
MREVMQGKMRRVSALLLPGYGTIPPRAPQHACAVWLFDNFDLHVLLRV